ncbi:hypothetical protein RHMOL_Rhmol06G0035200 [Rhododendron molle]|uniref:Uncharacterized protein n=1 Tax=Rhododendron molle TaxID=49168 RepID=A0ACC0N986_RHOML|nr:hypothetical protein RHMOL_Rhmol06G0035200 [Rhododendron molle]
MLNEVGCPPISKTKGRSKRKRVEGGREGGKQTKTCRLCKGIGHNFTTCPEKENIITNSQKKKKATPSGIGLNPIFCVKY